MLYIGVVNFILQLIQPVEGVPTKILIIIIVFINTAPQFTRRDVYNEKRT